MILPRAVNLDHEVKIRLKSLRERFQRNRPALGKIKWKDVSQVRPIGSLFEVRHKKFVSCGLKEFLQLIPHQVPDSPVISQKNVHLFFMGASSHLPLYVSPDYNGLVLVLTLGAIIGALEFNSIKGKLGPMTTVKGVIHCGLALALVLYALIEVIV